MSVRKTRGDSGARKFPVLPREENVRQADTLPDHPFVWRLSQDAGGRQRSTTLTPTSASRRRVSGKLIPITLVWPPSSPSTNQPPRPSIVKPPATCSGSPLAT